MYEQELIALADADVRFIVIGAVALGLHNYPRATADLDILPALDSENLGKVLFALESLGYQPRLPVKPQEILDPTRREEWIQNRNMKVFTFMRNRIPPQIVDVMISPPFSYDEAAKGSIPVQIAGHTINVASIDILLRMKQAAMRPKDLSDLLVLERLKALESSDKSGEPQS